MVTLLSGLGVWTFSQFILVGITTLIARVCSRVLAVNCDMRGICGREGVTETDLGLSCSLESGGVE